MNTNQFIYKRIETTPPSEGKEAETREYQDSFNLEYVIRSVELEDRRRIVLLDDMHERVQEVPQFNSKRDKITGYTKQRNTVQSEIYLEKEDSERFVKLFQ